MSQVVILIYTPYSPVNFTFYYQYIIVTLPKFKTKKPRTGRGETINSISLKFVYPKTRQTGGNIRHSSAIYQWSDFYRFSALLSLPSVLVERLITSPHIVGFALASYYCHYFPPSVEHWIIRPGRGILASNYPAILFALDAGKRCPRFILFYSLALAHKC